MIINPSNSQEMNALVNSTQKTSGLPSNKAKHQRLTMLHGKCYSYLLSRWGRKQDWDLYNHNFVHGVYLGWCLYLMVEKTCSVHWSWMEEVQADMNDLLSWWSFYMWGIFAVEIRSKACSLPAALEWAWPVVYSGCAAMTYTLSTVQGHVTNVAWYRLWWSVMVKAPIGRTGDGR